jgi:hypothetical protein
MSTRVAALWMRKYTDKNGQEQVIVSGPTGYVSIPPGANLILKKNTQKNHDKSPDYFLECDKPYQPKPQVTHSQPPGGGSDPLDDIPFP